jgi:predicted amidohydrolase
MKRSVFAVFLTGFLPVFGQAPPNFNAIIKGGTVYDGTGAEPRHVDLAIRGDRIAGIGDFKNAKAKTIIDAKGLAVGTLAFTARQTFFARVSEVVHEASAQACQATL